MGETTLISADFIYAAQRGGCITQAIIAAIMDTAEWNDIEGSQAFVSGEIVPTVTVDVTHIKPTATPKKLRWTNQRVIGNTPYFGFLCTVTSMGCGVVDTAVISEAVTVSVKPDQAPNDALDEELQRLWTPTPPHVSVFSHNEILYVNEDAIILHYAPFSDGWMCTFKLEYSTKQPIHQCDVQTDAAD
jgi:hypothetical protein